MDSIDINRMFQSTTEFTFISGAHRIPSKICGILANKPYIPLQVLHALHHYHFVSLFYLLILSFVHPLIFKICPISVCLYFLWAFQMPCSVLLLPLVLFCKVSVYVIGFLLFSAPWISFRGVGSFGMYFIELSSHTSIICWLVGFCVLRILGWL